MSDKAHHTTYTPTASSGKYGVIVAEKKQFHPNEPLFLIRATDPDAVEILRDLADLYSVRGSPTEQVVHTTYTPTASSGKYGVIVAEKKQFHPDEPLFLIRATDPDAVQILREAARLYLTRGSPLEQVRATREAAERIAVWQAANPDLVKKAAD
jgi:hypothetical protein